MTDLTLDDLTRAATAYERLLVPGLFAPWPAVLAKAAKIGKGKRVLDVACGSGIATRHAAEKTGDASLVTGIDANPGMLAVAAQQAPDIDWREGDAAALPFEDDTFDAVLCQFGMMFFEDRPAALREMARVSKPKGRIAVAVFDGLENNPAYGTMVDVFSRHLGAESGSVLGFPFCLGAVPAIEAAFTDAGLSPDIKTETRQASFASARDLVLADVEGWFPLAGIRLDAETVDAIVEDAEISLGSSVADNGNVTFDVSAHVATASVA